MFCSVVKASNGVLQDVLDFVRSTPFTRASMADLDALLDVLPVVQTEQRVTGQRLDDQVVNHNLADRLVIDAGDYGTDRTVVLLQIQRQNVGVANVISQAGLFDVAHVKIDHVGLWK